MKFHKSLYSTVIFSFFILFLSGCASIPSEAPELSTQLGNRISAIEKANINLLHKFFDLKRDEVDKFINEDWTPEFAKNLFSEPKIKDAWNTIVSDNDPNERLKFLVITGPKLQAKINQKRHEMIKPLDDLERGLEQKIRDEYTQARSINNSITSFLESASKIDENRQRYLNMTGASNNSVNNVIDGVSDTINNLLQKGTEAQNKTQQVENYINKLKALKNLIK